MNLFEKLSELVTPQVLAATSDVAGEQGVKAKLLSVFYPIFVAHLTKGDAAERLTSLAKDDANYGKNLLDAVLNNGSTINQTADLQDKLAKEFNLPTQSVSSLLNAAAPAGLAKIQEFAGNVSVADYAKQAITGFSGALPAWAGSLLPAGLLAGGATLVSGFAKSGESVVGLGNAHSTTTSTQSTTSVAAPVAAAAATTAGVAAAANAAAPKADVAPKAEQKPAATHVNTAATPAASGEQKGGFLKNLLPIIGLIIFGGLAWLLLRSCQEKPAPVAAPAANQEAQADSQAVAATPATLDLQLDAQGQAVASCDAKVGSQGVVGSISTAIATAFGTDACKDLGVTEGHGETMPAAEHLPALFGLMKGVPEAKLSIADKVVRFGAGSAADTAKLIEGAKGILPADFTVEELPAVAADMAAGKMPAVFTASTDAAGALQACQAQAGDDSILASIKNSVGSLFAGDVCQVEAKENFGTQLMAADQLVNIVGFVKGTPNAAVTVTDKTVQFSAQDPAAAAKLVETAKAGLPSDYVVEVQPASDAQNAQPATTQPAQQLDPEAAAKAGNESAKQALTGLADNATAEDVVKALNMQIINFATSSNAIPAENKEILDLAVTKLTALPDMKLLITGHTDSQGSAAYNKKLSESRATAVRDYLVSKGIAADRLSTKGAGPDNPVASNDTAEGRFQNRRIEFSVQ
ncbi:OmpA family protein [Moraxella sp.]|uniref:OmpA family protein n=1 Tax=Moraxella sp. TaxID=479 RepID=UPI0026DD8A13|nr:OmpA family protein [Moraxella sp.]MDO4895489.1 OmpA family protein [Moraxella sp.]